MSTLIFGTCPIFLAILGNPKRTAPPFPSLLMQREAGPRRHKRGTLSLMELSHDLLKLIIAKLVYSSFVGMRLSCKGMRQLYDDDDHWAKLGSDTEIQRLFQTDTAMLPDTAAMQQQRDKPWQQYGAALARRRDLRLIHAVRALDVTAAIAALDDGAWPHHTSLKEAVEAAVKIDDPRRVLLVSRFVRAIEERGLHERREHAHSLGLVPDIAYKAKRLDVLTPLLRYAKVVYSRYDAGDIKLYEIARLSKSYEMSELLLHSIKFSNTVAQAMLEAMWEPWTPVNYQGDYSTDVTRLLLASYSQPERRPFFNWPLQELAQRRDVYWPLCLCMLRNQLLAYGKLDTTYSHHIEEILLLMDSKGAWKR